MEAILRFSSNSCVDLALKTEILRVLSTCVVVQRLIRINL